MTEVFCEAPVKVLLQPPLVIAWRHAAQFLQYAWSQSGIYEIVCKVTDKPWPLDRSVVGDMAKAKKFPVEIRRKGLYPLPQFLCDESFQYLGEGIACPLVLIASCFINQGSDTN